MTVPTETMWFPTTNSTNTTLIGSLSQIYYDAESQHPRLVHFLIVLNCVLSVTSQFLSIGLWWLKRRYPMGWKCVGGHVDSEEVWLRQEEERYRDWEKGLER